MILNRGKQTNTVYEISLSLGSDVFDSPLGSEFRSLTVTSSELEANAKSEQAGPGKLDASVPVLMISACSAWKVVLSVKTSTVVMHMADCNNA